jgi:hypothetical protein
MQSDLQEEQHTDAVNLQAAIEGAEAAAQPRVRRLPSLTIIIIVRWLALLGLRLLIITRRVDRTLQR